MTNRAVESGRPASYDHVFRHVVDLPAESEILNELLNADTAVLDVGTSATGRSAKLARAFGPRSIVSIEINQTAIAEFASAGDRAGIELCAADLAALPFASDSFDVVLVAFHGMDYILDPEVRKRAFAETARVLRPGGRLVVNGWNRLGILFTPYGLKSISLLKLRANYVLRGDAFRQTITDGNGLQLHQSTLRASIAEVESETDLELEFVIDSFAKSRKMAIVALTSIEPYAIFRLPITGDSLAE